MTSRPAVRLDTISPASRSDASARAAVARSWALSLVTASWSAADNSAVSAPLDDPSDRRASRAAAMNFMSANVRMVTSAATSAVKPSNA